MYRKGIKQWNHMHPIYTPVSVGRRTGALTVSDAFISRKGRSMVWVAGFIYPVYLTRVKAL